MGEVVGEAWGGDFPHQLGHAIGTVLLVGSLALAGWLVLRGRVAWAGRWALAGAIGSIVGLALYVPILAMAPPAIVGLTIALTFFLPLITAVVFQAWSVRGHLPAPKRWAAAWFFAVLFGAAAAWYAGGGVEGAAAGFLYPVFDKAVAYWWLMIPRSLLGALVYGEWTALAVPLDVIHMPESGSHQASVSSRVIAALRRRSMPRQEPATCVLSRRSGAGRTGA